MVDIYFSDYFKVPPDDVAAYGAFDISLINDLPLFIDPFLLFNSSKPHHRELHDGIIRYLRFLRDRSVAGDLDSGTLKAWFMFSEVKQTWLGYSASGNQGSGLGSDFAKSLNRNLNSIFTDFGSERVTQGSHLEKLCLVRANVGRDNVSDFTTNLIKTFLLEYTQQFARDHLAPKARRVFSVERVRFNYETETWESGEFELPACKGDFVLLTPRDILTREKTWINRKDLLDQFERIALSVPNDQLRAQLNNYFRQQLSKDPSPKERRSAAAATIDRFPEVIEHFIRDKEDRGEEAIALSRKNVQRTEQLFVSQVRSLVAQLEKATQFYSEPGTTYDEAHARLQYLKSVIEDQDGYRVFYVEGQPIQRERDLHVMYRLVWFGTAADVSREVNDGRGPVDFSISRGAADKTQVEFKLASNTALAKNLRHQTEVYQKASRAQRAIKTILYFTAGELIRVQSILRELKLEGSPDVVLIDARAENKPSGSKAAS